MTHEAKFFSGDVMAQHWSEEEGGVATMAAKKKPAKRKPARKPKPKRKVTRAGPGCQTGLRTC